MPNYSGRNTKGKGVSCNPQNVGEEEDSSENLISIPLRPQWNPKFTLMQVLNSALRAILHTTILLVTTAFWPCILTLHMTSHFERAQTLSLSLQWICSTWLMPDYSVRNTEGNSVTCSPWLLLREHDSRDNPNFHYHYQHPLDSKTGSQSLALLLVLS